ncbi:hypothetical protein SAMN05216554_2383 [Herbiconiux ginsengi]|uniref:Fibronectin type-III domain-containing protein n=1 Tax=Herbiconiux ginsengi TaxID=381665 RepID=A0A1H3QAW4_9MICO|nr:hypothetical protein SAMN05216554_2383 [Herbiconiux ginsengi]
MRTRLRARRPWRFALGVFVVTFLVAVTGSTAGAYWVAASVSLTSTTTGATASGTLAGTAGLTKEYKFTGAGSASTPTIAPLVFANTGSAPLAVTLAVSGVAGTLAPNVALTFWAGSAGACAATIPGSGTTIGTLALPPALPADFASVAIGASVTLCAATRLNTTVAVSQGQTVSPVFTLTGHVGTNWTATAPGAAFTQSVYQVPNPAPITCVDGTGLGTGVVTLSWTAVPGATTYRIVKASDGSTVKASNAATSVTVNGLDLGLGSIFSPGTVAVLVQSLDSTYGTTSAGTTVNLRYSLLVTVLQVKCPA